MKTLKDLLLLGDPRLYEKCNRVEGSDFEMLDQWVADLHHVMEDIRSKYNFGRGIAAPQIGIMKQLIYINVDHPWVIVNPRITRKSEEMIELWDDCMCFPHLLVRVKRHRMISMEYTNENREPNYIELEGAMSELVQHEYDHLQGVLCTMRAIDHKSFKWR